LISILLAHAATSFVAMERLGGGLLAGNLPTWWAQVILPLGFGFMAFRFALRAALFAAGRLEPPKLEETL
jgi:TRAP-type C4-dicarboxylate transport system permease small subunit